MPQPRADGAAGDRLTPNRLGPDPGLRGAARAWQRGAAPALPRGLPVREADRPAPRLRLVGKAVKADAAEVAANPRARSAVMRVAERTGVA